MKNMNELKSIKKELKKKKNVLIDINWIIKIILLTFVISIVFSLLSEITIPNVPVWIGIIILVIFISIGVIFDMIGVAVTSSDEAPFHSMNSRKVKGADIAVLLKQNADKVSSFCNDVVGDICGIISGATSGIIAISLSSTYHIDSFITILLTTAFVASLTIGAKAVGKSFAINKGNYILYKFALIISKFYKMKK